MKSSEIRLSEEQKNVYESAMRGGNIVLLGGAGSGKSTVLTRMVKDFEEMGKTVGICAPTGVAAHNVEGQTIHSLFALGIGVQNNTWRLYRSVIDKIPNFDVLIIDEISMCRNDVFEVVVRLLEAKERIPQMIVVGDFWQNIPFVTDDDMQAFVMQWGEAKEVKFAFTTSAWKRLGFEVHFLKESQRQKEDVRFATALNGVAQGDFTAAKWIEDNSSEMPFEKGVYLYARKSKVDERNKAELRKIPGDTFVFRAQYIGRKCKLPLPEEIELKVGARAMCRVNFHEIGVMNGTIGKIAAIDAKKKMVILEMEDGRKVPISEYEFKEPVYDSKTGKNIDSKVVARQLPLVPAYALTIDKAQSLTLGKVNIDPECFREGQLYTALSRVRNVKDLYLVREIMRKDIKVSEVVRTFYKENCGVKYHRQCWESLEDVLVENRERDVYECFKTRE